MVGDKTTTVRFQNNIQSCFSRVRLLYGATPLEDIIGYNQVVRSITEWTGASTENTICQTSINEGIGGYVMGRSGVIGSDVADVSTAVTRQAAIPGIVNVRQAYIQGVSTASTANTAASAISPTGMGFGVVPFGVTANVAPVAGPTNNDMLNTTDPVKRYQVQFALGLFNQPKLIPTKFMASQLAIEITLANPSECIFAPSSVNTPTYSISNVNLIPEILEFDASYDEMFLKGLMDGGVPIKFATWNNYKSTVGNQSSVNIQIQERGRSVKSIFALQRRDPTSFTSDSGATFFTSGTTGALGANTLQEYQYRIGGRYFPAAPVQNSTQVGGAICNGGAESWIELSKALNTIGDARLATPCNVLKWAIAPLAFASQQVTPGHATLPEFDYRDQLVRWQNGAPVVVRVEGFTGVPGGGATGNSFCGNMGSCCFAMAIDLEISNGGEISGLNAEEQSDISLIARWNTPQTTGFVMDVYTYIDSMIVLRANNVLELIQ